MFSPIACSILAWTILPNNLPIEGSNRSVDADFAVVLTRFWYGYDYACFLQLWEVRIRQAVKCTPQAAVECFNYESMRSLVQFF